MPVTLLTENALTDASPAKTLTSCWNNFDHQPLSLVSTLIFGWKLNISRHMFYRLVLTLKWGCLLYLNVWLLRFYYHYKLSTIILWCQPKFNVVSMLTSLLHQRSQNDIDSTLMQSRTISRGYFNLYQRWINVECLLAIIRLHIMLPFL